MSMSPMFVGDLYPPFQPTLLNDQNQPINFQQAGITASMIKVWMKNTDTQQSHQLSGTVTILDPVNGVMEYLWQVADTAIAGNFALEVQITWPTTPGGPQTFGPYALVIDPL